MTRRGRAALKAGVWIGCLSPLLALLYRYWTNDLTANPVSFLTNTLGDWTLRLLLTSLALTPLRILFGIGWPMPLRRLVGLFAFFYASLHFAVWLVIDQFFDWPALLADILKRPFVAAGVGAGARGAGGVGLPRGRLRAQHDGRHEDAGQGDDVRRCGDGHGQRHVDRQGDAAGYGHDAGPGHGEAMSQGAADTRRPW